MKVIRKPTVLMERFPYRYIQVGTLEINGKPDCRIQKQNEYTKKWYDIYLFDNGMQCSLAMEDIEYCKWLDDQPCYIEMRENRGVY